MTDQPGALVIGGHANGLGVVRALNRHGITVDLVSTLRSDMAQHSRFVDRHYRLLELADRPESLIELLERHAETWRDRVILPTNDHALSILAKHHERLSSHFRLTFPPWTITRRVIDKRTTNALAQEVGIAVPTTFGPATTIFAGAARLRYPVLVKPVQGHTFLQKFEKKLFMVRNERELADAIERVEQAGFDCEIVEFLVGPDTCLQEFQVYIDASGKPHGEFALRKLRQEPPTFGIGRAAERSDPAELRTPSLKLLERIGWRGLAEVSYKTDMRDGRRYLLEVNGRCTLMGGLALRAGINYPLMAYSEATTGEIRGVQPNDWQGVWIHLHADFFSTIKNLGREEFTWGEFFRSYLRPKTFAVWAADDVRPFFAQWWFSLKKTPRRLREGVQWSMEQVRSILTHQPRHVAASERSWSRAGRIDRAGLERMNSE